MSPTMARAVSTALLGGLAVALFPVEGLLFWAGFIAWAGFLVAGGDTAAIRRTLPGYIFGACLGWLFQFITHQVDIPPGSWLWMPRGGIAMALIILVLYLAAKVKWLSDIPSGLTGFAVFIGIWNVPVPPIGELKGIPRLMGLHMTNPIFPACFSMVAGVLLGVVSLRLAAALTKR